jgi:hypothetical protein
MDHYLFLYPQREYVDFEWENHKDRMDGTTPAYLNDLIDARYRQQGFIINWLLFDEDDEPGKPASGSVSPWLQIRQGDRVLAAGVTFRIHQNCHQYATPKPILEGLPGIDRLVIGGFHQNSCVDQFAKAAHKKRIPTHVDEDTTDQYFTTTVLHGRIPLQRPGPWPEAGLFRNPRALADIRNFRSRRPWLTKI